MRTNRKIITHERGVRTSVSKQNQPRIDFPTDIVPRVTTEGSCDADLEMYYGWTRPEKGIVNEIVGMIEEMLWGAELRWCGARK
jgi:threonine dehydrogenase-like Zn-dependent dehydrogenase